MDDLKILKRREFDTPFEFEEAVNEYFTACDTGSGKDKEHPVKRITKHGLLVHLKIFKNTYWTQYHERGGMWESVCDYAIARIAQHYEEQLTIMRNPTGPIFGLKNMLPDEYKDVHTSENVKINTEGNEAYKLRLAKLKAKNEVEKLTRPVPLQKKGLWGKEKKPDGTNPEISDSEQPEDDNEPE